MFWRGATKRVPKFAEECCKKFIPPFEQPWIQDGYSHMVRLFETFRDKIENAALASAPLAGETNHHTCGASGYHAPSNVFFLSDKCAY